MKPDYIVYTEDGDQSHVSGNDLEDALGADTITVVPDDSAGNDAIVWIEKED